MLLPGEKGGFFSLSKLNCLLLAGLPAGCAVFGLPINESKSANGSSSNVKLLFLCVIDADLLELVAGIVFDKLLLLNRPSSKSSVSLSILAISFGSASEASESNPEITNKIRQPL